MAQIIPIYIPTYINNAEFAPARVLPRLLFYNGLIDCQSYYIESGSSTFGGVTYEQNIFPYFDNYNVVTGSFPTTNSKSLLFNNEAAVYGEIPNESLYSQYWEKYIEFLYNPTTRVLNCSAIIPLADYFHMELNDIVNFKGNYWHLRAINDYSLKTGECNLQLLGPVIPDVFDIVPPVPPAQASSSVSWSYSESSQDGTFTIYDNATTLATLTANGSGSSQVSESHYVTATLVPVNYPSSGSMTMRLNVNGNSTISKIGYTNTTISASFLVGANKSYTITGSIEWAFYSASLCSYQFVSLPQPNGQTWNYQLCDGTSVSQSVVNGYTSSTQPDELLCISQSTQVPGNSAQIFKSPYSCIYQWTGSTQTQQITFGLGPGALYTLCSYVPSGSTNYSFLLLSGSQTYGPVCTISASAYMSTGAGNPFERYNVITGSLGC